MAIRLGGKRRLTIRKGKDDPEKGVVAERATLFYRDPTTEETTSYLAKIIALREGKKLETADGMKQVFAMRMEAGLSILEDQEGFDLGGLDLQKAFGEYGSDYVIRLARYVFEGDGDPGLEVEELGKSVDSPSST